MIARMKYPLPGKYRHDTERLSVPRQRIRRREPGAGTHLEKATGNKSQKRGKEGILPMAEQSFMRVEEVAAELGISKSYAYKVVQKLNAELKAQGYLTISGRINRKYFLEKTCYGSTARRDV